MLKILVVDKSPAVAKTLATRPASGKPTTTAETRVVDFEPDYAQARRDLIAHPERYDAVVVDPYPPEEPMYVGAAFIKELKSTGLIVIVATASWRVEECVQCMREGAWDFIPKTRGLATVADSIVASLDAAVNKLPPADADLQYINNNLDALCKKYGGLWIAVGSGRFIDAANTYQELRSQTEGMPIQLRFWRLPANWVVDEI